MSINKHEQEVIDATTETDDEIIRQYQEESQRKVKFVDDYNKQQLLNHESHLGWQNFVRRLFIILLASSMQAFTLVNFMNPEGILPGGFSGVTILIQKMAETYWGLSLPYSLVNIAFNILPAIYAFKNLGKRFVTLSVIGVLNLSILVDLIPKLDITDDIFLSVVFGSMLYGLGSTLILNANASSGGTDFIAMSISQKTGKSTWNYVLAFNAVIYIIYGIQYGFTLALYSIIFQFLLTSIINQGQVRYQRRTAFIVTKSPDKLARELMEHTGHGVTILRGQGAYTKEDSYMLYMVIERRDVRVINAFLREYYPDVFLNITDSEELQGNFKLDPFD